MGPMRNQVLSRQGSHPTLRRLSIRTTLALPGLGEMNPATRATEGVDRVVTESHLMLSPTERMERRQERSEDRGDDQSLADMCI
jgi:hypothetical protein